MGPMTGGGRGLCGAPSPSQGKEAEQLKSQLEALQTRLAQLESKISELKNTRSK